MGQFSLTLQMIFANLENGVMARIFIIAQLVLIMIKKEQTILKTASIAYLDTIATVLAPPQETPLNARQGTTVYLELHKTISFLAQVNLIEWCFINVLSLTVIFLGA